jgi:hypothetical protein
MSAGEQPFVLEGEQVLREGETRSFAVVWDDFTTISTAGTAVYVGGSDQSALISGTTVVTDNVQTLPLLTVPSGSGGTVIVIEPSVKIGSTQVYKTGIVCHILKPGSE